MWSPLGEALSPWERLEPERKLMLLMALAVILFLALMLLILIWVGGRWVRRLARMRQEHRRSSMIGPSDWEPQPYVAERDDERHRPWRDPDSDDSGGPDPDQDDSWRP